MTKTKVAVLGGGMAGLAAAFELSERDDYCVTVYTLDWLLGGKGASTRNEAKHDRIEEHGLHIWFGFYDNAFALMDRVYAVAGGSREQHFIPCGDVVLAEPRKTGGWALHRFNPPVHRGAMPGDDPEIDYWDAIEQTLAWVVERWGKVSHQNSGGVAHWLRGVARFFVGIFIPGADPDRGPVGNAIVAGFGRVASAISRLTRWIKPVSDPITRLGDGHLRRRAEALRTGGGSRMAGVPHVARRVSARRRAGQSPLGNVSHSEAVATLLGRFLEWGQHTYFDPEKIEEPENDDARLLYYVIDTVTAVLNGVNADHVNDDGLNAIDDMDLRDWLLKHKASQNTVDNAPFIRALYDLAFGYRRGESDQPDIAAGKGLQACARISFMYRDHLAYKATNGLGDAVFAPLYLALKQRGVKFEFCHEVKDLEVGGGAVTKITGTKRVPKAPYEPLRPDKTWPSAARWGLGENDAGPATEPEPAEEDFALVSGKDFDKVVLAISGGCLETVCRNVSDAVSDFKTMVENTHAIATQALQVWLTGPLQGEHWQHDGNAALSGYKQPLASYSGMKHVLPKEGWTAADGVQDLAYFCGVLPTNGGPPLTVQERVEGALTFVAPQVHGRGTGIFSDWDLLFGTTVGPLRADEQYYRQNTKPAELYVTTHKDTPRHRLWPHQSGLSNLVLAGDWTRNGIDGGCMEAAVASGFLAADALTGSNRTVPGTEGWLGSEGKGRRT
ncbi:FAD-dependent oxidoreductase [Solirubrobacter soli]|uniref:FAD-dependent oxidoreductase n=1 Tax=Solirubrobacter soli TaxID=363832 RepID=UPI000421CF52|nr:FAD-dependent oxidoreductase [Solirubrobacter soli]